MTGGNDPSQVPATTGHAGVDITVTVIVALVAGIPGIGGLILAWRKRRQVNEATATEFGTRLAEQAFSTLSDQVLRLMDEQRRHDEERTEWEHDRVTLVDKIGELTAQLRLNNTYLRLLLMTLDAHGIAHPAPPPGFELPHL